jgi:enamine deaminase RidA (YjgF/YER057c/UK114 family)
MTTQSNVATSNNNQDVEATLKSLNITLPEASKPAASYVPYVVSGNMVYISGQLPLGVSELSTYVGQLGNDFTLEQGQETARVCGLNVLAQLRAACGNLNNVVRCVKLTVFVNSTGTFTEQPQVANGASDLMVKVFGSKGAHARSAIGVSQLPRGVAAEVEAVFEIA